MRLSMECQVMMGYKGEVACKDTQEKELLKMKCVVKGTIVCLVGGKLMLSVECQVMMGYKGEVVYKYTQGMGLAKASTIETVKVI